MATDSGYSNQKKKGIAQFETIHNLGSSSFGKVVGNKALYIKKAATGIDAANEIIGANGQVEFWSIILPDHTAVEGGIARFKSGSASLSNFEFEIVKVIDSNEFYILPISNVKPQAGFEVEIYGWITQKVSSSGEIPVAIVTPPTSYQFDGSPQSVIQDSTDPLNNKALPNLVFFIKDGVQVPVEMDSSNPLNNVGLPVTTNNLVVENNSSYAVLGISEQFVGSPMEITNYSSINVNVFSDVPSAQDGVKVEFSTDGVNWDHSHSTTYLGSVGRGFIFYAEYRFARVVYTNGTTSQSVFRLQTILKSQPVKNSLVTLNQTINDSYFAELNRSVITGRTTAGGGGYVDVKVNPSGALTVEAELNELPEGTNNIGSVNVATTLVPLEHDEIDIAYVGSSTDISTVTYKKESVTVATLTLSYDGSGRLSNVVRS